MHREGRMLEMRRGGVHRLAARAPKSTAVAAAKTTAPVAAASASVAKVVPSATATKAVSTASTAAANSNTAYSPGVAATGSMTAVSPTTPPGGGAYPTTSIPKSTFNGSFASLNTASYSPALGGASGVSAKPVLSPGALIGIIAGGGAVGVAILAMFFCWCWKKRKAKRDEASWWTIDASLNGRRSVGGNPLPGKGTRLADSEVWGKGESDGDMSGEKHPWDPRDAGPGLNAQRRAYDDEAPFASYGAAPPPSPSNYPPSPSNYQMSPAAPYPESLSSSALSPRDQLLGLGPAPSNSRSVASSASPNSQSPLPTRPDESSPFEDAPPRPRRPSDTPTFGPEGVSAKATKRKSMKPTANKKDTIMNFTDAYGDDAAENERWALPQSPPLPPTSVMVPPQRGASRSDSGRSSPAMTAPLPATRGLYPPTPLTPSPASNTDSFPPRPHGQEAALPPEGPRVDSKPLRELEDILDSFAINALHRQTLPPIPDDESLRDSITSSAAPSVAPLALNRSPRSPVPQIPSSPSIDTLSPDVTESFLAYRQASPYEMSHSVSVYSHAGDIGELPADSPPVPTPPLPVGGLAAILQAPAPAIFRSDSTGRTPLGGGVRKAGYRSGDSDSTTLSELADFPSPTATATHFVRKVSIKQENPVRLTREESLRLREAAQARRMTAAERDIVSQMGLDSLGLESPKSSRSPSPSALSISPPETPRDFNFGPLGGGPDQRKDAFQDPLQGTGFVPLSAMTLDPGAGNYRSATESIYGMYDDLPVELKGLPRDDPRVSRHISMFGLTPR